MRKATGSYSTYLSIVKLQPWFLSCSGRPAFGQNCNLGCFLCSGSCPWAEHSDVDVDDDDDDDDSSKTVNDYFVQVSSNLSDNEKHKI